jgi:hypothetical protein
LNAIGLWTDDYVSGGSPLTPFLLGKVGWTAGVTKNDVPFQTSFPYVAAPHRGSLGLMVDTSTIVQGTEGVQNIPNSIGLRAPGGQFSGQCYPNPATVQTTFQFHVAAVAPVSVTIVDVNGNMVATAFNQFCNPGDYTSEWQIPQALQAGNYFAVLTVDGGQVANMSFVVSK